MRGLLHTRLVHDQILQDDVLHGHLSVQPLAFLAETRLPDCHSDPGRWPRGRTIQPALSSGSLSLCRLIVDSDPAEQPTDITTYRSWLTWERLEGG